MARFNKVGGKVCKSRPLGKIGLFCPVIEVQSTDKMNKLSIQLGLQFIVGYKQRNI